MIIYVFAVTCVVFIHLHIDEPEALVSPNVRTYIGCDELFLLLCGM